MNKYLKALFSILYPWFPLWAWLAHFAGNKPVTFYFNIITLPLSIWMLASSAQKLPRYLIFFIGFVLYHVASSFINNTVPADQNKVFFILYDYHIFACTVFILIEKTVFDAVFIKTMNRNIFIIIILSLIVSVIQIKDPNFFYNQSLINNNTEEFGEIEIRNASIFSWYTANSGGITFPILISLVLGFYELQKSRFLFLVLAGIVVSFLTKARYVMVSMIIVLSQLFFSRKQSVSRMISLIAVFAGSIVLLVFIANQVGFDIQKVISSRILEEDSDMESAKARIVSYEVFLKKFPENPWLGVGPATRADVVEMLGGGVPLLHVGYLSFLYFYGIVGCLFFFIALFYLVRDSWVIGRRYKFWGSFYAFITFCVANATFVYFNCAEMGIVLSVIYLRFYKSTYPLIVEAEEEKLKTGTI